LPPFLSVTSGVRIKVGGCTHPLHFFEKCALVWVESQFDKKVKNFSRKGVPVKIHTFLEPLLTLIAGLAMKRAINWPFDVGLYLPVIVWLGPVWGGLLMAVVSVPLNLLVLRAYDRSQRDWLMIERVKSVIEAIQIWFLEEEEAGG